MVRRHRIFPDELPYIVKAIAETVKSKQLDELKQGEGQALFGYSGVSRSIEQDRLAILR